MTTTQIGDGVERQQIDDGVEPTAPSEAWLLFFAGALIGVCAGFWLAIRIVNHLVLCFGEWGVQ